MLQYHKLLRLETMPADLKNDTRLKGKKVVAKSCANSNLKFIGGSHVAGLTGLPLSTKFTGCKVAI